MIDVKREQPRSGVVRNLTILYLSQILTGVMSLLPIAFIPKYLGAVGVGQVTLAASFTGIFAVIAAIGTATFTVREIARDRERLSELVMSTVIVRTGLAILLFPCAAVVLYVLRYPADTRLIVLLMHGVMMIQLVSQTFAVALQGLQNMTWRAMASIVNELVIVVIGWVVLSRGGGVIGMVCVLGLSFLAEFVVNISYFYLHAPIRITISRHSILQVFRGGMPFFLWGFIQTMYQQTSSLMLSKLGGEEAVGWYGGANQFIIPLFMLPGVVITVLLPQFSQLHMLGPVLLREAISRSMRYMTIVTIPMAFGMAAIARQLIDLFNYPPSFQNSIPVLQVLAFMVPGTSLLMIAATVMAATNRERAWATISIFSLVAAVILNGLLIPVGQEYFQNPALGAATAGLLVELVTYIWALWILGRAIIEPLVYVTFGKAILAGALMATVVLTLSNLTLFVVIPLAAVIYIAAILALKVLPVEEADAAKAFISARQRMLLASLRSRFRSS